jgi:hypothetical protein
MKLSTIVLLLLFAVTVQAEPVTISSTIAPTFGAPLSGTPDGYRLFEGCDLATQTKGAVVDGAYTSGKPYSINADSSALPVLCVVAYNAAGEGSFDAVINIAGAVQPPGAVINLNGGDCAIIPDSGGNAYTCTITIISN